MTSGRDPAEQPPSRREEARSRTAARVVEAADVRALLGLSPHPEGGWFAESWRARAEQGERPAGTAIYYLLAEGQRSAWHRLDAPELWHHYAGAPLWLELSPDGLMRREVVLGDALDGVQLPQHVVPAGTWMSARSLGAWTLVGCTMAPAFDPAGFELAPQGWEPGT